MTPLVTSDYFAAAVTPHLLTPARSQHQTALQLFGGSADSLGLEMCVDEIDESEEENNEVLEVDDDSDAD